MRKIEEIRKIEEVLKSRKIGILWLATGLPQWLQAQGAHIADLERFFFGIRGICAVGFQKILKLTQDDQKSGFLAIPWQKQGLILNLSGQTNPAIGLQVCDLQKVTVGTGFGCPHGELVRPLAYRDFQILTAEDQRYRDITLNDFGITRFERGRLATAPTVPDVPQGKPLAPSVPVQPGLSKAEIDKEIKRFELDEKRKQAAEDKRLARKATAKVA